MIDLLSLSLTLFLSFSLSLSHTYTYTFSPPYIYIYIWFKINDSYGGTETSTITIIVIYSAACWSAGVLFGGKGGERGARLSAWVPCISSSMQSRASFVCLVTCVFLTWNLCIHSIYKRFQERGEWGGAERTGNEKTCFFAYNKASSLSLSPHVRTHACIFESYCECIHTYIHRNWKRHHRKSSWNLNKLISLFICQIPQHFPECRRTLRTFLDTTPMENKEPDYPLVFFFSFLLGKQYFALSCLNFCEAPLIAHTWTRACARV